jgi:hypothetical protein
MSAITRKRLDVPEVHRLLAALDTMVDDWAETDEGSRERRTLWRNVHRAADDLAARAYGGPTLAARISYWLRPYDPKRDARCWRWRRLPCVSIVLPACTCPDREIASRSGHVSTCGLAS